jgi:hypothetical protein
MATESPFIHDGSQTTASADLSAKQFFAVKITAARVTGLVAAATDFVYGILQNKPKSGQVCDVAIFGITKAIAGGSVTAGHLMGVSSGGQIVEFVTSSGNTAVGYAIESGASAQIVTLYLFPETKITVAV